MRYSRYGGLDTGASSNNSPSTNMTFFCPPEFIRAACDLMNFYFVYDEYTDIVDPKIANDLATIVIENMTTNPRAEATPGPSKHILGDMTQQ